MLKKFLASVFAAAALNSFSHAVVADGPSLPDLPLTLTSFGAARLDNQVFVYGGHTGEAHEYSKDGQSDQLLCLNLAEPNKWEVASTSTKLQGLALVADDHSVIRIGGFSATNEIGEEHALVSSAEVARFTPTDKEWTALPSLPAPRSSHEAILIGTRIFVVGGWQLAGDSNSGKWHTDALTLDLAAETPVWKPIATPPFQRRAVSLAHAHGKLLVIGGMQPDNKITKGTAVYDIASDTWAEGPELHGDGRMLGFGSAAHSFENSVIVTTIDGSIHRLADDMSEWSVVGHAATDRFFHELVPLDSDTLLVLGGANMESGKFTAVEAIDVP